MVNVINSTNRRAPPVMGSLLGTKFCSAIRWFVFLGSQPYQHSFTVGKLWCFYSFEVDVRSRLTIQHYQGWVSLTRTSSWRTHHRPATHRESRVLQLWSSGVTLSDTNRQHQRNHETRVGTVCGWLSWASHDIKRATDYVRLTAASLPFCVDAQTWSSLCCGFSVLLKDMLLQGSGI